MSGAVVGAGLGALVATGVITAVRTTPPMRRPRFDDRLAPYLRDTLRPSRLLSTDANSHGTLGAAERLIRPLIGDLARWIDGVIGGSSSVRRRLDAAGRDQTVEQFRAEQVVYAATGLGVGLFFAAVAATTGSTSSPIAFAILALVLAVGGVVLRDRLLTRAVARREERLVAEFPTVAELLALAVGAGESPIGALDRVARRCGGELSKDLTRALADARAGMSLVAALEAMAARSTVPALARFVDGMAVAVERGTPLADVLRAQAVDVREEGRRALLAAAGRKEIAMLVPVVFFVLPVTVVFALFPGFYSIRLAVA